MALKIPLKKIHMFLWIILLSAFFVAAGTDITDTSISTTGNITGSYMLADYWNNISITKSQISDLGSIVAGGTLNAWQLVEANITDLSHTVDTNTNETIRVGLLETKVINVNTSSNIIDLIGAHTIDTNTNESVRVDLLETKVANVNTTANIENLNFVQGAHTSDTTYTNGSGLSLVGSEFNHSDTSSQVSSDNSGKTFVQDIILDTFGHVTSLVAVVADFISVGTSNAWVLAGENITSGTIGDARIASTIARDSEVVAKGTVNAWQLVEANITDLSHTVDTTYSVGNGIGLSATVFSVAGNTALTQDVDGLSVTANSIGDTQLAFDTGQALTSTSAVTFLTVNTGQGANELFDMDQNVLQSSTPTFLNVSIGSSSNATIFHNGSGICIGVC